MKRSTNNSVTQFRMTTNAAELKINSTARIAGNVIFDLEAMKWMSKYAVTDIQALDILRNGKVLDNPIKTDNGDWECRVEHKLRGQGDSCAVTIILCDGRIYLFSISWE